MEFPDVRVSRAALTSIEYAAASFLACPLCHTGLAADHDALRCTNIGCGQVLKISDDVVLSEERRGKSFFDRTHELMSITTEQGGIRRMCYSQQTSWLGAQLDNLSSSDLVVADVGCGPRLPYHRSQRYFLAGVDASFESVRLNGQIDLRIFGSASRLPFRDSSVGAVICFYLLHHLIGRRVSDNYANLEGVFREFSRVLRPGGAIYVFEVNPVSPFFALQRALWNLARRSFQRLDMFFWSARVIQQISRRSLPAGTKFRQQEFHCPFWVTFPFVFVWPRFQLPRGLFPFRAHVFEWRLPLEKSEC